MVESRSSAERLHSAAHCCQEEPDGHRDDSTRVRSEAQRRVKGTTRDDTREGIGVRYVDSSTVDLFDT